MKTTISILGLGLLGLPLGKELTELGHIVKGTTRTLEKKEMIEKQAISCEILDASRSPTRELLACEVIVLNIPPFEGQLKWFESWEWDFSKQIIFVSSTSVYVDTAGVVDENSELQAGNLSAEEAWIQKKFSRHAILRAGGILGPKRHPGRILSGRKDIGKGHHPVNLIHVDDLRGVILNLINSERPGIFNVVSDEHHSRKDFYQDFCRRQSLALPEFDESDDSLGKIVSNEKLKEFYELRWPTLLGKDL